jgi:6-pyruvoyltetrahydropterin/6-carboxytetrahydropterin synthase
MSVGLSGRTPVFGLVFSRRYSMAHRLIADGDGKCAVPHGHNEVVTVRLQALRQRRLDGAANMVTSFEAAKARWHRWIDERVDHAFQLSDGDPLIGYFRAREPNAMKRLLVTPGDPTTEMLAACFMAKLNAFLQDDDSGLRCVEVAIEETPTNSVIFAGDPAEVLPERQAAANRPNWWWRADASINDFDHATTP